MRKSNIVHAAQATNHLISATPSLTSSQRSGMVLRRILYSTHAKSSTANALKLSIPILSLAGTTWTLVHRYLLVTGPNVIDVRFDGDDYYLPAGGAITARQVTSADANGADDAARTEITIFWEEV